MQDGLVGWCFMRVATYFRVRAHGTKFFFIFYFRVLFFLPALIKTSVQKNPAGRQKLMILIIFQEALMKNLEEFIDLKNLKNNSICEIKARYHSS